MHKRADWDQTGKLSLEFSRRLSMSTENKSLCAHFLFKLVFLLWGELLPQPFGGVLGRKQCKFLLDKTENPAKKKGVTANFSHIDRDDLRLRSAASQRKMYPLVGCASGKRKRRTSNPKPHN
jgi:hypothetical protein